MWIGLWTLGRTWEGTGVDSGANSDVDSGMDSAVDLIVDSGGLGGRLRDGLRAGLRAAFEVDSGGALIWTQGSRLGSPWIWHQGIGARMPKRCNGRQNWPVHTAFQIALPPPCGDILALYIFDLYSNPISCK